MKSFIKLIIILLQFLSFDLYAHKKFREVCKDNNIDTSYIKLIDKEKFENLMKNSESELNLVFIFTNYCDGTSYVLKNLDTIESTYQSKVKIFLCNSAPYRELTDYAKLMVQYPLKTRPVYIIDSEVYKDKLSDDRVKGLKFRDDICEECKGIIIGVPFTLIYDKYGKLLTKGYPSKLDYRQFVKEYFLQN